jgi:type I restriction enzyme S subunit
MKFELISLGAQSVFFNNLRKPVTRSARTTGRYPYYGAAGIQDLVSDYLFDGKYILVGEDGTVVSNGEYPVVQIAEGKFWVNNHAHVLRPLDSCDFDFLYYLLKGTKITNLVTGAVQPKLSMTNLKSLELIWPEDPKVRLAIGQVLRLLDRKIQTNIDVSKTLEDIAQTIFKSWFIYFDPVKAKMAGEKPVGMDDATAALFPDSMENSGLGSIPRGWTVSTVGQFSPLVYGKALPARDRNAGLISVFGSNGIVGSHNSALLRAPTVVIGRKGTVGTVTLQLQPSWVIDTAFSCSPEIPENLYFAYLALSDLKLNEMNSDAAVPGLNRENVHRLGILIGTTELLRAFALMVGPLFELSFQLRGETGSLNLIRDSLLPRLISGELQIPEEMLAS